MSIAYCLFFILIPTPDFPHFYYMIGGNLGSLLYVDVSVMSSEHVIIKPALGSIEIDCVSETVLLGVYSQ